MMELLVSGVGMIIALGAILAALSIAHEQGLRKGMEIGRCRRHHDLCICCNRNRPSNGEYCAACEDCDMHECYVVRKR